MNFLFEQLPLQLQPRDHATFDNFYAADNAAALDALARQLPRGERYLYLYGPAGSGRSHLLQAACHRATELNLASVYLPLAELGDYAPEALFEGLEQLQLVCLDDIDAVAGDRDWEVALFGLFNALADAGVHLLISARASVRELPVNLPDLRSRLSAGSVFRLAPLSDAQQSGLIRQRAARRGLELGDDVLQFILHRCQRDTASLLAILEQLDRASLREQRRLTIPFVKATLDW